MVQAAIKTFAMVTISAAAFMASPMAFPFVLMTVFCIWAIPYAIAAFLAPDEEKIREYEQDHHASMARGAAASETQEAEGLSALRGAAALNARQKDSTSG